jgi:hypothetical protein
MIYMLSATMTRRANIKQIFEVLFLSQDLQDLHPLLETLDAFDAPNNASDTSHCTEEP